MVVASRLTGGNIVTYVVKLSMGTNRLPLHSAAAVVAYTPVWRLAACWAQVSARDGLRLAPEGVDLIHSF